MILTQLDKLAKSIKAKEKQVTASTLTIESLFHNFGTLTEEQASILIDQKRSYFYSKFPHDSEAIVQPAAIAFLGWSNDSSLPSWMK